MYALGHRADPRRAPQGRHRRQRPLHPPLPTLRTSRTAQPELAYLPRQPRSVDLGSGPLCGPDPDLPDPLRLLLDQPPPPPPASLQRDAHPTAARVWRQMIEATPWGLHPKYLIHDRDRVYGADFATRMAGLGIESVRTPVRALGANAIGERVVRTLRRECLDHILPLSERHVRAVLAEYASYYNQDRPHRSLELETPVPSHRPVAGEVVARPVLGGLHHVYERA
jgi:hypothetical protein